MLKPTLCCGNLDCPQASNAAGLNEGVLGEGVGNGTGSSEKNRFGHGGRRCRWLQRYVVLGQQVGRATIAIAGSACQGRQSRAGPAPAAAKNAGRRGTQQYPDQSQS